MPKIFMILSPAKTMDLHTELPESVTTVMKATPPCCSPSLTTQIATSMKKLSTSQLKKTLKLSDTLASTTAAQWQAFGEDTTTSTRPALYTYSGPAFQGIEPYTLTQDALHYVQERLRILSAAYGVLQPLDPIHPYRLEMGISCSGIIKENTTKFSQAWSPAVTASIVNDMKNSGDNPILLNLASDEYAAAVNMKEMASNITCIKVIFRQEGRVMAVHAKRARGLMVRYLATHKIDSVQGIQQFDWEGYTYQGEEKADSTTLVFDRKKQPKGEPKPKRARKS